VARAMLILPSMETQITRIVAALAVDPSAPTMFEPTAAAPSSRSPKAYDRNAKIAQIKAMCSARLAAFESSL
jgi:hypothetical protein